MACHTFLGNKLYKTTTTKTNKTGRFEGMAAQICPDADVFLSAAAPSPRKLSSMQDELPPLYLPDISLVGTQS